MLQSFEITCTLCGLKVAYVRNRGNGHVIKEAAAFSAKCKLADEIEDFNCPRLQEAIHGQS
jgi:hypothetical protein